MNPDIAASVRARLLSRAKKSGESFELYLVRYACERFLYRLGASPLAGRCVLKGAGLLAVWMQDPYRATRDVDLLAEGASDEAAIREAIETICRVTCPEDGVVFDLERLAISPIRPEEKYAGRRAVFTATLGRRNSRMKDFHDVWALAQTFEFEGRVLQRAVAHCFERRGTAWTPELPDVLGVGFYNDGDARSRWEAYLRAGDFRDTPPETLHAVGECLRRFLGPVREAILDDASFETSWPPGGPWKAAAG